MTPSAIMEATSRALEDLEMRTAASPKTTPFHPVTVVPLVFQIFAEELRSPSRLTVEITLSLEDFRLLFAGQEIEIEQTIRSKTHRLHGSLGDDHQVCYRSREWLEAKTTTTTTCTL